MADYQFTAKGVDDPTKLRRYTDKKIASVLHRIPRRARVSAKVAVVFNNEDKQKSCRVTLQLPHETLVAEETTVHLYAALDIACTEMKRQLGEYKATHSQQGIRRRMARLWHR